MSGIYPFNLTDYAQIANFNNRFTVKLPPCRVEEIESKKNWNIESPIAEKLFNQRNFANLTFATGLQVDHIDSAG